MTIVEDYMATPEWRELERCEALGRPLLAWRKRPRHVLDLMDLSVGSPAHDFLVQGAIRVTFATFQTTVETAAADLFRRGIRPNDRVLIVLYNSPEFWLALSALWRLGAIPVLGNRWWSAPDLRETIGRLEPAAVVTDMPLDTTVTAIPLRPADLAVWWEMPPPDQPLADPRGAADEDDVAVIVFTAGSTGAPKSVQLSHRNLVWTQQTIHVMRGGRPVRPESPAHQKVALATTPLFHNGGMVAALGAYIDGGRIVMLRGKFDAAEAIELIASEGVTSWSAVPTMYNRVLRHRDLARHDLSSLVAPATGGATVAVQLLEDLRQGLPRAAAGFSSGYGMTEMSFLTMAGAADFDRKPGTVGRMVPGVEMRVDAPDEAGEGELLGRSGALMVGYLGAIEQPIDPDGWYRTGDIGCIDAAGFVFVTGRSKDMVIRGGENISCQHVEAALASHADVLEVAVVGYPDEEFGEALAAMIFTRPGTAITVDALATHARQRLAYFEVPSRWILRDAPLPVLPTGKVDKRALGRELAEILLSG